jgi:hypothetical protein
LDLSGIHFLMIRPPATMPRAMWRAAGVWWWVGVGAAYLLAAALALQLIALLALAGALSLPRLAAFVQPGVVLPVNLLCCLALWLAPRMLTRRMLHGLQQHDFAACLECGYWLDGLPDAHKCPECGKSYDIVEVRVRWRTAVGLRNGARVKGATGVEGESGKTPTSH